MAEECLEVEVEEVAEEEEVAAKSCLMRVEVVGGPKEEKEEKEEGRPVQRAVVAKAVGEEEADCGC